jgi:hypothetical protein
MAEVEQVVDVGHDVFMDALEITLGGFIGYSLIDVMPLNLPIPRDLAVSLLGIGTAVFVKNNRTVRNLGYGMAVSGAMNFIRPYVAQVVDKTVNAFSQ